MIAAALSCLFTLNMAEFFLFGCDKKRAKKGQRRIPERTLMFLAASGGSIGALAGMYVFRHKTRKWKFKAGIPILLLIQVLLICKLGTGFF